ncbi:hypothetical protein WJX72_008580 [[Myrmecia] bisecta]|uniref:Srp40 C-terminal domain-containing protein n=1 Tax=[Myrmecia] bisecta TaxID=41462 RepID=A0AAW1P1U0_9CHLO
MTKTDAVQTEGANAKPVKAKKEKKPKDAKAVEVVVEEALVLKKDKKSKKRKDAGQDTPAAVEENGHTHGSAVKQPVKEKEKKSKKRKLPAEAQPPAAEQPEAEADAVAEPPAAKKVKKVKKTASAAGADTADAAATAEDAKEAATSNGNGSDALKSSGKDASNGEGAATGSRAFQRVKAEEWLGAKGSWDNSYRAQYGEDGYGLKAQEILGQVRGRDFRHEKTKKKRGSYRGGLIDDNIRSFKFESDGE